MMTRIPNKKRYPTVKFSQYMRTCKDCEVIFKTEWKGCKTCPDCMKINEARRINSMRIAMLKHHSHPT